MSSAELGVRLNVSRQAVHALEGSEAAGNIKLVTLRRVAEAMGCQMVYAIVPLAGGSLEDGVQAQAGRIVDIDHAAVTQTMALEGSGRAPLPTDRQNAVDDLLRSGNRLWRTDLEGSPPAIKPSPP